jgi:hypothetical protein
VLDRASYWLRRARTLFVSEAQLEAFRASTDVFFVLGIGRSGTTFLADLLDRVEKASVQHEPLDRDFRAHQEAFRDPERAFDYVDRFRAPDICLRAQAEDAEVYGEVNSVLRRHAEALQAAFPEAGFLHLVRDGRDVVRSMYSATAMLEGDPNTQDIYPREGDPYADEWPQMSRFERVCWYWRVENRYLRQYIDAFVRFEDVLASHEGFREGLLEPLGLELPEPVWAEAVDRPKNPTRDYDLPAWPDWNEERKQAFAEICGEEMRAFGYDLD